METTKNRSCFVASFLEMQLKRLLPVIAFTIISIISHADDKTINGVKYSYDAKKSYAIASSGGNASGDVTIEKEVTFVIDREYKDGNWIDITKTLPVKVIGSFSGNTKITSVTANSIEIVGLWAFEKCTSLKTVKLGNTLKEIKNQAFYGCTALSNVNLPDGLIKIGDNAFEGCSLLFSGSTLKIPSSVTEMGIKAFRSAGVKEVAWNTSIDIPELTFENCKNLVSAALNNDFSKNVQKIGEQAFAGCQSLKAVDTPSNCLEIGRRAFSGCTGLTSITFHKTLRLIGERAFYGCTGLINLIFPENCEDLTIGISSFGNCKNITRISFKNSKKIAIGEEAFWSCENIKQIDFADGIVSIDAGNFNNCTDLKSVVLPETLVSIGMTTNENESVGCFCECNSLTHLDLPAPKGGILYINMSFNDCKKLEDATKDPDKNYENIQSFMRNDLLKEVRNRPRKNASIYSAQTKIGQGTTVLRKNSFHKCVNLEVFEGPFELGEGGGLRSCHKLVFDEYHLPYKEEVPSYAIPGRVKKAIINQSVRVLHENAIYSVESVNMPDSLRIMHSLCLSLNYKTTELTLPDSICEIYSYAIDCPMLKKLTVKNPVPPVLHKNRYFSWEEWEEPSDQILYGFDNKSYPVLYVPKGSAEAYRVAPGWKYFKEIVEIESSGIDGVEADDNVRIDAIDGRLYVTGCDSVMVYSVTGALIYSGHPDGLTGLEHGVYILRAGKRTVKVAL